MAGPHYAPNYSFCMKLYPDSVYRWVWGLCSKCRMLYDKLHYTKFIDRNKRILQWDVKTSSLRRDEKHLWRFFVVKIKKGKKIVHYPSFTRKWWFLNDQFIYSDSSFKATLYMWIWSHLSVTMQMSCLNIKSNSATFKFKLNMYHST